MHTALPRSFLKRHSVHCTAGPQLKTSDPFWACGWLLRFAALHTAASPILTAASFHRTSFHISPERKFLEAKLLGQRAAGDCQIVQITLPLAKYERTFFPVGLKQKYTGAPAPSQQLWVWGGGTCAVAQKEDLSWKAPWAPADLQPLPSGRGLRQARPPGPPGPASPRLRSSALLPA